MPNPLPYLDALGITVWQRRDKPLPLVNQAPSTDGLRVTAGESALMPTAPTAQVHPSAERVTQPQLERTTGATGTTAVIDDMPNMDAPPDYLFVPADVYLADNFEPLLPEEHESFEPAAQCDPKQRRAQHILRLDWDALQARVQECQDCELHQQRNHTVFGVGDPQARWLIIGEAPGHDEDLQGEPFVGRAGQLLNAMLQAVSIKRQQVYIANTVKCRPPHNRNPDASETQTCAAYLQRQIQLIQPQLILLVGRVAAQQVLGSEANLGELRGRLHTYADTGIPVVVSYHPAYLLRFPAEKGKAWADLQLAYQTVKPLADL